MDDGAGSGGMGGGPPLFCGVIRANEIGVIFLNGDSTAASRGSLRRGNTWIGFATTAATHGCLDGVFMDPRRRLDGSTTDWIDVSPQ